MRLGSEDLRRFLFSLEHGTTLRISRSQLLKVLSPASAAPRSQQYPPVSPLAPALDRKRRNEHPAEKTQLAAAGIIPPRPPNSNPSGEA